ncbi:MAG: Maf family protein [Butyrivibrio sp.]|nr:Maf family protein [Butyrivibrio sp.]
MRYILASGSPRRKELLSMVVPEYEVIPAKGEEKTSEQTPDAIVEELSYHKASEIFNKILRDEKDGFVVIGADTVVSYKQKILGKPKDRSDAADMIRLLQGHEHQVYTGVTVFYREEEENKSFTFSECTNVKVTDMTEDEITSYAGCGEPDDKAGAYALQGKFGIYITGIDGDYYNVVGLPVARLYHELKDHGLL